MSIFYVGTRKVDGVGGPVARVNSDDFDDAEDDALARTDVQAAGGVTADYTKEITGNEAADGGFASQTTLAAIATSTDNIDDKLPAAQALNGTLTEVTATLIGAILTQYNGTIPERVRGNQDLSIFTSAAHTTSGDTSSADQVNYNAKGLHLYIKVTAITSAPSITVKIQGRSVLTGDYYTILESAAISTVSVMLLKVYPGLPVSANVSANDILPRTWRVTVTAGNTDSITYSVAASTIL